MAKSIRPPRGPDEPAEPTGDYEVGYCKPPVDTRFKPGASGNPKGRPKGAQGLRSLFNKVRNQKVPFGVNGQRRVGTMGEVIVRRMMTDAAQGKDKARKDYLAYELRYEEPEEKPSENLSTKEEEEIFNGLLLRLKGPGGSP